MKLFGQNGIPDGTLQTSTATMTNECVMEMREDGGVEWPMQLIEEQVIFRRVREMGVALHGWRVDMERLRIGVHDVTFPRNP